MAKPPANKNPVPLAGVKKKLNLRGKGGKKRKRKKLICGRRGPFARSRDRKVACSRESLLGGERKKNPRTKKGKRRRKRKKKEDLKRTDKPGSIVPSIEHGGCSQKRTDG